jgi:AcrR family transcriptional regulator
MVSASATQQVAPSRVEARKASKHRAILDAALVLFAERGFHGTAVPLVAERAGVGAGTIYRFFASKEDLVNGVFRDAKGRLLETLQDGLDLSLTPRALFDAFWSRLVAFARTEPIAFRFLELQDHVSYLDAESRSIELGVLAPIFLACADFQRNGVLRTALAPETTMAFIWGAFVGVMKAERLGYVRVTDEALVAARDACWRAFVLDDEPSR